MSERARGGGVHSLLEGLRIAVAAMTANKARSGLTILGVAVGVAVVVLVAALITGIRSSVMEGFEAAGPNNFILTRFDFTAVRILSDGNDRPPWWNMPVIIPEEASTVERLPGIAEALYSFNFSASVDFEGESASGVQGIGYSAGWPSYTTGSFVVGRDFTPAEVRQSRAVVVLSRSLSEQLFGQRDPIGKRVGIGSPNRNVREEFRVIGVYEQDDNIFQSAASMWFVVPHTAGSKRLKVSTEQAQVFVVPEDSVPQARAMDDVVSVMRASRGLGPREENNFALLRSDQIMEVFDRLTGVFFLVMLALSSVGLMVGGVGVIGIMLISVTERTREIGIRKAVGATRREILWQFLVEAGLLTLVGGALGMGMGAIISEVVERVSPIPAAIPAWAVVVSLAMAVVTGMVFGLLPAYRASRLEPTDALRYE